MSNENMKQLPQSIFERPKLELTTSRHYNKPASKFEYEKEPA